MRFRSMLAATLAATGLVMCQAAELAGDERPFEGLRALVIEPENFWGWDAMVFGALEERGFEMTYAKPEALEKAGETSHYDLIATDIRRGFSSAQVEALKEFLSSGGALYGSWGGPMGTPALLQACHVGQAKSVRIMELKLLGGTPLTAGLGERKLPFPRHMGHMTAGGDGWEIVAVEPLAGGITVAQDPSGNSLGVLGLHDKGRTAVLGFGCEQEKQFSDWKFGPVLMDNLLKWLLDDKLKSGARVWSKGLEVSLPARAEVLAVSLDGKQIKPAIRTVGSLKKVLVDVSGIPEGSEATIRLSYKPLAKARSVETFIHLPWATLTSAASSPAGLAGYLESIRCTIVQPLLRGGYGEAWYKGMPQDRPDEKLVTQYRGNFLSDLIAECKKRGIKLIGGVYFGHAVAEREPEATLRDRNGQERRDQYKRIQTCFNHPKGQEYNLETIRRLITEYQTDGVILDDNFELDANDCYCNYCKEGFGRYCQKQGVAYADPSTLSDGPQRALWKEYQKEATRELAARVARIAHERGQSAGGWVGASMKATHLAASLDFLGGMVYTEPPRAARLPLSVLGEHGFVCLLWAPDAPPDLMEHEVREAVHAGSSTVGFWTRGPGGQYRMDEARTEAIGRAFESVEAEWLRFFKKNLLSGDARFALLEGQVGREETILKVRNTGRKVVRRVQGRLEFSGIEQ